MAVEHPLHPTQDDLILFALGKIEDEKAEAVRTHIDHCDECRRCVAETPDDTLLAGIRHARVEGDEPGSTLAYRSLPAGIAESADFQIKRELGRGGMGVVYLAHNTLMGRDEVIKVMSRQLIDRAGALDRFLREIRAVAKLRHANIVTAYSAKRIGENIVFSMEYVEGLDLARLVKAKGPLPVNHACFFVHQAAMGLQHAHEEGMVHRDIKPANLMLARKGSQATIKILDFGLAKFAREERIDGGLTSEGQALGTPDFIAPEQITDAQGADIRADLYSLGGTLYYLLSGRPPFEAKTLYDLYQAHISLNPAPVDSDRQDIPAGLAALVVKLMAKNPDHRFQTPIEVAESLRPFFQKGAEKPPIEAIAPAPMEPPANPRRFPIWARVTMVAGILAASLFGVMASGVLHLRTKSGVIAVENAPQDAVLFVDGERITVRWPGGGAPLEISLAAGSHGILVKKEGFTTFGEVVTVAAGGKHPIRVRLLPDAPASVPVARVDAPEKQPMVPPPPIASQPPAVEGKPSEPVAETKAPAEAPAPPAEVAAKDKEDTTPGPPPVMEDAEPPAGAKLAVKAESAPPAPDIPAKPAARPIGIRMVLVPAGRFLMGSAPEEFPRKDPSAETPKHLVRISRRFLIGATEVTQGQYRAVRGANPSRFQGRDDYPVETVSWFEAIKFCNDLSAREGFPPFYVIRDRVVSVLDWTAPGYRLPTDAEWEYACRADTGTIYPCGNDEAMLAGHGWIGANANGRTHAVGGLTPNGIGLFDMIGNVQEWCWDAFRPYAAAAAADPVGPEAWDDADRVYRNAAYDDAPFYARSSYRGALKPDVRSAQIGFRVARNAPRKPRPDSTKGRRPAKKAEVTDAPVPPDSPEGRLDDRGLTRPGTSSAKENATPSPPAAGEDAAKVATPLATEAPKHRPSFMNSVGLRLNLIPAGEFMMGSPDEHLHAAQNEKPRHLVKITQPFYMATTEMTNGIYRIVTGIAQRDGSADENAIRRVTWQEAIMFCNLLSEHEGLKPYYHGLGGREPIMGGTGYRLPREAEWEYACRAGSSNQFVKGDSLLGVGEYAWHSGNLSGLSPQTVGLKKPNAFGLYDMLGNVSEWCADRMNVPFEEVQASGPIDLSLKGSRVVRGGSISHVPSDCRPAIRASLEGGPWYVGFRIVRDAGADTLLKARTGKAQAPILRPDQRSRTGVGIRP